MINLKPNITHHFNFTGLFKIFDAYLPANQNNIFKICLCVNKYFESQLTKFKNIT